jgi:uncharacterized repeat protein (TIGR03803 family)
MPDRRFSRIPILVLVVTLISLAGHALALAAPVENVLWSFGGAPNDGWASSADLLHVGPNFYGATRYGGVNDGGVVYRLTPPAPGRSQWSERVLWSFGAAGDRYYPSGGMIHVGRNFYGTTYGGGANGYGTVFKLTP